jgi:hypothetical protein
MLRVILERRTAAVRPEPPAGEPCIRRFMRTVLQKGIDLFRRSRSRRRAIADKPITFPESVGASSNRTISWCARRAGAFVAISMSYKGLSTGKVHFEPKSVFQEVPL